MKKVLIVTEVFAPEDFVINDLVKNWIESGYKVEVLTRNPSYPYGKPYPGFKNNIYNKSYFHNAIVHSIFFIPGYQQSTLLKLFNYVNYVFLSFWILLFIGKRFDKIFIYQTGPLTNALTPVFFKRIFNWKITIWTQDLWPETVYAFGIKKTRFIHWFLSLIVGFIYKRCDVIFVSCKGFIPIIEKYIDNQSIFWKPNWTLIEGKSNKKVVLPGKINFTFTGNIGKVQNLDNVVRGFKNVSINYPDVYLNIIGDGSFFEELKIIVQQENIKNINFTGRLPLAEMPNYFEASDVLILSLIDVPIYEIMIPSKFQTYLSASKPIYSIINGELSNLVKDYNLGFTANPSSINEIETGFNSFIKSSDSLKREMIINSKILESNYFSKENTIRDITFSFFK